MTARAKATLTIQAGGERVDERIDGGERLVANFGSGRGVENFHVRDVMRVELVRGHGEDIPQVLIANKNGGASYVQLRGPAWVEVAGRRWQADTLEKFLLVADEPPAPKPPPALSNTWTGTLLDGSTVDLTSAYVEDGQRFQPGGPARYYLIDLLRLERDGGNPSTNGG